MKFAICNETFQDWPFDKAFAFASELGYTGIELAPFTLGSDAYSISADRRAEVKRQAQSYGLDVVGLHWLLAKTEGYYLTSPDTDIQKKTTEYFCELARLCRDVGGSVMVLGSPQQRNLLPGVTDEQAMQYAADVISGALPTFEQCGITLALEALGPEEGDFLVTTASACQLMDRIGSARVKLHLDVKAMSTEDASVPDLIRDNAERIAHFHANDPNRRGPGMGDVDFVPIFKALHDISYDGWVSVEVFDYSPGIDALARDSIKNMQSCWEQLALS